MYYRYIAVPVVCYYGTPERSKLTVLFHRVPVYNSDLFQSMFVLIDLVLSMFSLDIEVYNGGRGIVTSQLSFGIEI